ncbi:MAG TPA: hypothetical protein VGH99_11765 [Pseudonocardia sp.]
MTETAAAVPKQMTAADQRGHGQGTEPAGPATSPADRAVDRSETTAVTPPASDGPLPVTVTGRQVADTNTVTEPADGDDALRRVLDADDEQLDHLLRFDGPVRDALRCWPNDGGVEEMRTLVAAARIERRRRRARNVLAAITGERR